MLCGRFEIPGGGWFLVIQKFGKGIGLVMEERSVELGGEESRMNAAEQELFFGRLAERLRQKVEKAHFETWLSRLQCRGAKDGILEFIAPNAFTKDWIQKHYHDVLREAARSMDGRSWRILLFQGSDLDDGIEGHPCLGSFSTPNLISRKDSQRLSEGLSGGSPEKPSGSENRRTEGTGGQPSSPFERRNHFEGNVDGTERDGGKRDQGKGRGEGTSGLSTSTPKGHSHSSERPFRDFPSGGKPQPKKPQPKRAPGELNAPLFLSEGGPEDQQGNGSSSPQGKVARPKRQVLSPGTSGARSGSSREAKKSGALEFFSPNSDSALNPSFTFENFVVGSCNELTFAAAKAVAEFPGGPYNPLFIHGASGLGKTHLLQGICHGVLRGKTPRRILYLSCENFINQFIQAVTNGNISDFRYNCRHVDMLLVDDIQMLEGKSRTQEEFFHTFNTLFNNQKQIVLSSDRAPKELRTLQDRLVSRFGWGMVTRLDSPCLETRVAIVKRKARMRNFELSDEVARFLAEHVDTNVRELEGAVTKLLGMANLMKRRIDLSLAEEVLTDYRPTARRVPIQKIMELVAREFGVQSRELQSKTRVHSVVLPRQIAILLARRHTSLSLKQIGGFFGDRNHATVMHSIKKAEQILEENEEIRERIQELTTKLLREG
jgi:chromosomal replication initiator protein